MKKITLILGVSLLLASCAKEEEKTYCAFCTELTTGSSTTTYCGTSSEVDTYIANMESNDPTSSEVWSCYKEEEFDHTSH